MNGKGILCLFGGSGKREAMVLALLLAAGGQAWAAEVTADQARTAVMNWARRSPHPLEANIGQTVGDAKTYRSDKGEPLFHVVRFAEGGFVVTSADDGVRPVIAFSESDDLVPDERNTLWVMLNSDLPRRLQGAQARAAQGQVKALASAGDGPATPEAEWQSLLAEEKTAAGKAAALGRSSVSDVRVSPLVQSRWGQATVGGVDVYNYYTPNHYVCGCVATAGAQIMRYHRYPTASVYASTYSITVDGRIRWAAMTGGIYDWAAMPLVPTASSTLAQRQAIGKLTYDLGVATATDYTSEAASAYPSDLGEALVRDFGYANAQSVWGDSLPSSLYGGAILANLDAGFPVSLGLSTAWGEGHQVVGDGYGYNAGVLYTHLNMGWDGDGDAWYNLPSVNDGLYNFTIFDALVFNVFPSQTGEIVSGRVFDSAGRAVSGAAVTATDTATGAALPPVTTNVKGIYAVLVPEPPLSGRTYEVTARSAGRSGSQTVSKIVPSFSGSVPGSGRIGNRWGINLTLPDVTPTVTFDAAGGTVGQTSMTVTSGEAYGTLPVPTRPGYVFEGWWKGAGGTGVQITAATAVTETANHTLYAKWAAEISADQTAVTGVTFAMALPEPFAGAAKVTVKGLPAGLTYNAATRTIAGVPTRAGTFGVSISAPGAQTQTFTLTAVSLPAWAQGAFTGYVAGGGSATMSVSAQGKVTGKIALAGTNYTFSAASYAAGGSAEEGFAIAATAKAGKAALPLTLLVRQAVEPPALGVAAGAAGGSQTTLWRDVWKEAAGTLAPLTGYYTATLPGDETCGSGYLTFTVDKAGKVKVGGKLADGTLVSLSGTLILDDVGYVFAVVYAAPAAYEGGRLFGLAEFVTPEAGAVYLRPLDGEPFLWQSRNPQATETYGAGFDRAPGLTGGWYGKTADLGAYYAGGGLSVGTDTNAPSPALTVGAARYDAVWWDPAGVALTPALSTTGVMAGLTAPAAGKPTDADKNGVWDYASATNTVGLRIALTRATGVFKGSFRAWFDYPVKRHVSKSVAFEGVLTPEREDTSDGVEGRGFFRWPDKASPPAPARPYSFKWSYDFLLFDSP